MDLPNLNEFIKKSNGWLTNLSSIDPGALHVKSSLSQLKQGMPEERFKSAYEFIKKTLKESVRNSIVDESIRVLVLQQLQKWGKWLDYSHFDRRTMPLLSAIENIGDPYIKMQDKENLLRDALTKGSPTSQISPHSQQLREALDKIIAKLAALNQPLRNRPDYGTTGDIAERLKKFKDEELDAAMYKQLELPNPKPVAIDYDAPELSIKNCRRTCPRCHGSHREPVLAHCMEGRFKRIRGMLKGRGEVTLSGAEIKTILNALNDIHQKYRELEDR